MLEYPRPVATTKNLAPGVIDTHVTCCWHIITNTKYDRMALNWQDKLLGFSTISAFFYPSMVQETLLKEKGCCVACLRILSSFSQLFPRWITLLPAFQLLRSILLMVEIILFIILNPIVSILFLISILRRQTF